MNLSVAKRHQKTVRTNTPEIPGNEATSNVLTRKEEPPSMSTGGDADDIMAEADMLGDMFSAIPDEPATNDTPTDRTEPGHITLRDFGKQSGVTPRRCLEETVRSRDPGARVTYKMVSPTTYRCRHAVTITWSKELEMEYDTDITGVTVSLKGIQMTCEATSIAAVGTEQSESYISTVALFSISSAGHFPLIISSNTMP